MKKRKVKTEASRLRMTASLWMEHSLIGKPQDYYKERVVAAYMFIQDRPVTVYEIQKQPWVGSYRSAKRWCDDLIKYGIAEETKGGMKLTDNGETFCRSYFDHMYRLGQETDAMFEAKS